MRYDIKTMVIYGCRFVWWLLNHRRFAKLGLKSYIHKPIRLTPSCIDCGRNVLIYKSARIEGVFRHNASVYSPKIKFEDNVSIQQNLHLTCADSIIIGSNTAIASNVTITDIHHSYLNIDIPIEQQDLVVKSVTIGQSCKIYNNVVVLPGCNIGNHVTLAANSVVTKDIPSYSVAVGAPAKVVKRYNFDTLTWEKTNSDGSFLNTSQ